MDKRLFLLLIFGLIGVVFNPVVLSASDSVNLTGLNEDYIVETVPVVEPVPEPVIVKTVNRPTASSYAYSGSYTPLNNISIGGRAIELVSVGTTELDAGGHVNRFGAKFLYGHNTPAVFSSLSGVYAGNTFSITENGITSNYVVSERITFKKISDEVLLDESTSQEYLMSAIAYNAKGHSLAIMTCAGVSYGNGDASHRLVLFADAL